MTRENSLYSFSASITTLVQVFIYVNRWLSQHCVKSVQIRIFFLVYIFLYLDWILRFTSKSPYSVRIQENTHQKKLRIWTLFTQWELSANLQYRNDKPVTNMTSWLWNIVTNVNDTALAKVIVRRDALQERLRMWHCFLILKQNESKYLVREREIECHYRKRSKARKGASRKGKRWRWSNTSGVQEGTDKSF